MEEIYNTEQVSVISFYLDTAWRNLRPNIGWIDLSV